MTEAPLPPYTSKSLVAERLPQIFPEGTERRNFCIRDLAASTVFTMLYIGAVAGAGRHLAPKHVYRMTDSQAERQSDDERRRYGSQALVAGFQAPGRRWYADNTREPIRDETLREGLVTLGAAVARDDLPTTSGKPRYALTQQFAALFDPELNDERLAQAIENWQAANLSPGARARIAVMRRGAAAGAVGPLVQFPSGETRRLATGPSSEILKAAVEAFAPRFLTRPAVLWLSESGNKVVARDDELASAIGLKIEADRDLPDLILVDLAPAEPIIVFVEAVATDGAVTERRMAALHRIADAGGFARSQVAFVTAYLDRGAAGFRRTFPTLAWNSFAWLASEPESIILLRGSGARAVKLSELLTI